MATPGPQEQRLIEWIAAREAGMALSKPAEGETFRAYLERLDLFGHGFSYDEVVEKGNPRKQVPEKRSYWPDFALALAAANAFRERAMAEVPGLKGLRVNAAYRPNGGAENSAHKRARALDLDRIGGYKLTGGRNYFRCAVRFWCQYGKTLGMGCGLYTWAASTLVKGGIRFHIDVLHGCRSWQGVGAGFRRPFKIKDRAGRYAYYGLAVQLAQEMGLDVPSLSDL